MLLLTMSATLASSKAMAAVTVHTAAPHSGAHAGAHASSQRQTGYLGIEFHDVTDEQAASLRLRGVHGAEIAMVDHDGPAGHAGLKAHDIIVALNGQAVDGSPTLKRLIHDLNAGAEITLEVIRNGEALTLNAKLANRDEVARQAMQRLAAAPTAPAPKGLVGDDYSVETEPPPSNSRTQQFLNMLHTGPFTGLAMDTMEPQLAAFFGAPSGAGLLVHTVLPNSPASAAGLRAGDVVLRADAVVLKSPSDWTHHLRASRGSVVTLTVLRDKHEQTVVLVPDLKRHSVLRSSPDMLSTCCASADDAGDCSGCAEEASLMPFRA